MKTQLNQTTESWDLSRYEDRDHLLRTLEGFDGIELMYYGEDERGLITNDLVVGFHSNFFNHWVDLYQGNTAALIEEYGSIDRYKQYYGSSSKEVLFERLRNELKLAKRYEAEYLVLHVADCSALESFTGTYKHSSEEVVDALAAIVNTIFTEDDDILLLLENLWVPGLTLTDPQITHRLMEQITYKNKGIMLDTGHIMHTDTSVRTGEEAVTYINRLLDADKDLISYVKGIHLNQSLTGEYFEHAKAHPPILSLDPKERGMQLFKHIYSLDVHEPFVANGVKELVERIAPDYLTYEFIIEGNEQLMSYIQLQRSALD